MNDSRFTATENKILTVLEDGQPHKRDELLACLPDELADNNALQRHLCAIRRVIKPLGHDIVAQLLRHSVHYRHIKVLQGTPIPGGLI